MKLSFKQFIPGILWFLLIVYLLTIPGKDLPSSSFLDAIYFDKWVHIGLFSTLVFLFLLPLKKVSGKEFLVWLIPLAGLAFGIAMEYVQKYFIPGRSFDVTDIIADGVGCLLGWLVIKYYKKGKLYKKSKPL